MHGTKNEPTWFSTRVISSMGNGTKNFLHFFFSKIITRKKIIHFDFYVKGGWHHKFPLNFSFQNWLEGGGIYVKVYRVVIL